MNVPLAALSSWVIVGRPRQTDGPLGPVDQDPEEVRDAACELTVDDEICFPPEPDLPEFQPDVSTSTGGGSSTGLGTLLVVLLVIALIALLVWLVMLLDRRRRDDEEDDDEDEGDLDVDLDELVEPRLVDRANPPDRWRAAAEDHRAAGRYRDSIRCQYRALVGDLARAGIVDEIPGRTSGEERDQLARLAPAVSARFGVAADLFDRAWFGDEPVDGADDREFLDAERTVLDAVLSGTAGRDANRTDGAPP